MHRSLSRTHAHKCPSRKKCKVLPHKTLRARRGGGGRGKDQCSLSHSSSYPSHLYRTFGHVGHSTRDDAGHPRAPARNDVTECPRGWSGRKRTTLGHSVTTGLPTSSRFNSTASCPDKLFKQGSVDAKKSPVFVFNTWNRLIYQ